MKKNALIITVLIAFFVGALGSILLGRFFIPYLAQSTGWESLNRLVTNSPIIINRTSEVYLNDGINLIDLVRQTSNSTVSIYTGSKSKETFSGLGVVMSSDGLIFTAKSALRENTEVTVVLNDGRSFKGLARAADPKSDLAIVSIEASGLTALNFDSSFDLKAGQRVFSLGIMNRTFEREFNSGFVQNSVLNNKYLDQWHNSEILSDSLASDLTGRSNFPGAPVMSLEGRLVGMVAGDKIIIAENLQTALNSYLQTGKIIRPKLGMQYLAVSDIMAALRNFPRAGVAVLFTDKNSAASEAGLVQNDLIFEANGQGLDKTSFEQILNSTAPDGELRIKFMRGGQEKEAVIKLKPTQ